jgi:hypothetical protein
MSELIDWQHNDVTETEGGADQVTSSQRVVNLWQSIPRKLREKIKRVSSLKDLIGWSCLGRSLVALHIHMLHLTCEMAASFSGSTDRFAEILPAADR